MYGDEQTGNKGLRAILRGISWLYEAGVRLRGAAYRCRLKPVRKLPCFVISVGNLTVGGTGKSLMVLYLSGMLRGMGYEAAVISRGYRGSAEQNGGMVSDGRRLLMASDEAGDEPYMLASALLAESVPVMVGQDRVRSGMLAVGHFRPHVILMDDGFQHRRLHRDLDMVLLDGGQPLGNGNLLPRGTLREPPGALKRADITILTRTDRASTNLQIGVDQLHRPGSQSKLFRCRHKPYVYTTVPKDISAPEIEIDPSPLESDASLALSGKKVFGFSGIARNQDFEQTVKELGAELAGFKGFDDHHRYSVEDFQLLQREALACKCEGFVTTEKDFARFGGYLKLSLDLIVIGVKIDFGDQEEQFRKEIEDRLPPLS